MKKALVQSIIVVLLCGTAFAVDPNVSWIKGETPPGFDRFPAEPTTNDIISFTIPTDVYPNQWEAEQSLGGTPTITLDPDERRIEVLIQGPAPADPLPDIDDPVCGLKGYFGPLEQGSWVLFVQYPGSTFIDGINVIEAGPTPVISGTVTDIYGQGIGNVIMIFSNDAGTAYTNTYGYYFHPVPKNWYGTVTPVKGDYIFNPASRTYSHVTSDRPDQDYVAHTPSMEQEKGPVKFIGTTYKNEEQSGDSPGTYQIPVGIDDLLEDPNNLFDGITAIDVLYNKQLDIRPDRFGKVYVFGYYNKSANPDTVDATFSPYYIIRLGDVSGNGEINSNDAFYIEGYLIGIWDLAPEQFWAADVNGDGVVDELDEDLVSQYADGLIDNFPADSDQAPPPPAKQYYVEQFASEIDAFDLENKSITFTPDDSGYAVSIKAITQLPVDPTLGTNLGMGDDSVIQIGLSENAEVLIYGYSFGNFYVTSNGFITFTEPDSDYSETIEDHFDTLRISALFTDLDPSANGRVNGLQLSDRVVISWFEVPGYDSSDNNTFQIEMFYDGRIRLSWLDIGVQECIVGLSDGSGVPANFQETDFSKLLPAPASDYFTEMFFPDGDPFDLSNKSLILTPTADQSSYTFSLENITELPVDYFGSFNLNLDDDDYSHVELTYPTKVTMFGTRYPGFYVGSNGYITFTEGDIDHTESLDDHFDLVRISGLFDDLNPAAGGHIGWKQISQSVVVTWEDVPEYNSSNTNTFQVEMFFNGTIRISWLDISAKDGIVGLSQGLGLLPGFKETDFSKY